MLLTYTMTFLWKSILQHLSTFPQSRTVLTVIACTCLWMQGGSNLKPMLVSTIICLFQMQVAFSKFTPLTSKIYFLWSMLTHVCVFSKYKFHFIVLVCCDRGLQRKWTIYSTVNPVTWHWISVQNSIVQLIPSP